MVGTESGEQIKFNKRTYPAPGDEVTFSGGVYTNSAGQKPAKHKKRLASKLLDLLEHKPAQL